MTSFRATSFVEFDAQDNLTVEQINTPQEALESDDEFVVCKSKTNVETKNNQIKLLLP